MRRLVFNLHLYVALVTGAFILILGITGSIMAFETELGELFHANRVFVAPGGQRLSLGELSALVLKDYPGERVRGFHLATRPNRSDGIVLGKKTVYVNPYTGKVLGVQIGPDPVAEVLASIHQFHLRLLVRNKGDTGKEIIRWSAVAMVFLLLTGLFLWWPRKRFTVRRWQMREWMTRGFWYDIHNMVGIFSTVFLLMLALTGVAIGFERQTISLFNRITRTEPVYPAEVRATPPPDARPITPDQAAEVARAALPGALPFDLIVPGPAGAYDIRSRYPEDLTPGGRSRILVDQYTGKVLFAQGSRTAPASVRLLTLNRGLHTGDIFGMPSKIAMALASLAAALQVVSGLVMWGKRLAVVAPTEPISNRPIHKE